jgi:hypothetical protein
MNYFKTLAAVAALFFATSHLTAAHAAPPTEETLKASYVRTNIVRGKTTTNEVLAKFGEPTSQTMDDSSETWTYTQGGNARSQAKKKGGGFGGLMGLVKGVAATAYEIAPEAGSAASRLYSGASRAERTANAAGGLAGAGQEEQATSSGAGPSVLQINFSNDIVSSFSLR